MAGGSGRLRHSININTVTKTREEYGGSVKTETVFAAGVRCKVTTKSSSQGGGDAIIGGAIYSILMRYRKGVTKQHSITYEESALDITGLNFDQKHNGYMTITAKERDLD